MLENGSCRITGNPALEATKLSGPWACPELPSEGFPGPWLMHWSLLSGLETGDRKKPPLPALCYVGPCLSTGPG